MTFHDSSFPKTSRPPARAIPLIRHHSFALSFARIFEKTTPMKTFPLLLLSLLAAVSLNAQDAPALQPLPPDGFVTLQQIMSDFSSNQVAAMQKYNGMRVLVYGRVGQVGQSDDSAGNPLTVFLQQANDSTPDVKCVFTSADIPAGYQDAQVRISEDGTQASIYHRNFEGNLTRERPYVEVGQNLGVHGTFDNFVAGDIVLKDCRKVLPQRMMEILGEHGLAQ